MLSPHNFTRMNEEQQQKRNEKKNIQFECNSVAMTMNKVQRKSEDSYRWWNVIIFWGMTVLTVSCTRQPIKTNELNEQETFTFIMGFRKHLCIVLSDGIIFSVCFFSSYFESSKKLSQFPKLALQNVISFVDMSRKSWNSCHKSNHCAFSFTTLTEWNAFGLTI